MNDDVMRPGLVFLSGPMGSGKSTVGRRLADLFGVAFFDLDQEIASTAGKSVQRVFSEDGEGAFRTLERSVLEELLVRREAGVVALGGGTVVDPRSRTKVLRAGTVITLMAPVALLAERTAAESGRPLLRGGDAKEVLARLLRERAAAYAECHAVVDTDRSLEEVLRAIAEVREHAPIVVPLGERSYRVWVSPGCRERALQSVDDGDNVLWAIDENVEATAWCGALLPRLRGARSSVPAGEVHKTLATVERLWNAALRGGLDRGATFVALGGGVTGDLVGFAASTYLRGVGLIQVPTTLLSMVDSAVGGKTGFDRPEGKNLIGTFHQPRAVYCDPETLATLPEREFRAGLAEAVKSAWIAGEEAVTTLENDAQGLGQRDASAVERCVRRSVSLKRDVVVADEREGGSRRLLNLGHTVGHALEAAGDYETWRHGEAVAMGLVAAFRFGVALGTAAKADADRMARLLKALGLPAALPQGWQAAARKYIGHDKKRRGRDISLVLPGAPGKTEIATMPLTRFEALLGDP